MDSPLFDERVTTSEHATSLPNFDSEGQHSDLMKCTQAVKRERERERERERVTRTFNINVMQISIVRSLLVYTQPYIVNSIIAVSV